VRARREGPAVAPRTIVAFAVTALACAAAHGQSRDEPLWEAGAGIAALYLPDYRGASQGRVYALPVPYLVYRGDFLKADRHGLRGMLFDTDRVDLDLSVGAALPVDSSRSPEREGMRDLRPTVELGPSLDVTLWRAADRRVKVDLRLPVRGAVTVESRSRYTGVQFFPHLNVDVRDVAGLAGWNLGVLGGPVYTDRRYNEYFYSVGAADATPQRPAYDARGGYGGAQFIVALSKRFPRFWVGAYLRHDTLRGAVYEASPLVGSRSYTAGGIGLSWIFGESSRRVPVSD